MAASVRPGPERCRRPCPAPDGIRQGRPLRGCGDGVQAQVDAREHGVAPTAGGPEERLQLHRTTDHPSGRGANVPIHVVVGTAGLPAARVRWSCPTGTSDANTGGHPG